MATASEVAGNVSFSQFKKLHIINTGVAT